MTHTLYKIYQMIWLFSLHIVWKFQTSYKYILHKIKWTRYCIKGQTYFLNTNGTPVDLIRVLSYILHPMLILHLCWSYIRVVVHSKSRGGKPGGTHPPCHKGQQAAIPLGREHLPQVHKGQGKLGSRLADRLESGRVQATRNASTFGSLSWVLAERGKIILHVLSQNRWPGVLAKSLLKEHKKQQKNERGQILQSHHTQIVKYPGHQFLEFHSTNSATLLLQVLHFFIGSVEVGLKVGRH